MQAIAVAAYYRSDWPLLVICPSSLRVSWAEAFEKWIPTLSQTNVGVVLNGTSPVDKMVTIISYDLVSRLLIKLKARKFGCVIADEVQGKKRLVNGLIIFF